MAFLVWPCIKSRQFLVPLVCLETSFNKTLGKKKDRIDFLHHVCGLDVHGFCPPGEKRMILIICA